VAAWGIVIALIAKGGIKNAEEFAEALTYVYSKSIDMQRESREMVEKELASRPEMIPSLDDDIDEMEEALEKFGKDVFKLQEEYENASKEAEEEFW